MKKFCVTVLAFFLIFVLIAILPGILIDPYNVFHPFHIRENGVEPNKNYIKMKYILANPEKFDTFVFGSSLVGAIHTEKLPEEHAYNMTHSGAIPAEHLANLKTMLSNGIVPKKIYIGLEGISYMENYESRKQDRLRCPYEYSVTNPLSFFSLYLDPAVNFEAVRTVIADYGWNLKEADPVFYETGVPFSYGMTSEYDPEKVAAEATESHEYVVETVREIGTEPTEYSASQEALDSIAEIRLLCEENGIELVVFINPNYFKDFETAVTERYYLSFLRELAEVTPYYSFCGYNQYTTDHRWYFYDDSHYFPELGDIMIDAMCYGNVDPDAREEGFGQYVTSETVDEYIAGLSE